MKGLKSAIKWIVAIALICAIAVGLASINGLKVSRTIATVNGSEITEAEYKFYVEMAKLQVLSEEGIADEEAAKEFLKNGTVEEKPAAEYIKDKAMQQVLRIEVAVVKAKEAGISLTDEERSAARKTEGMDEMLEMYKVSADTYADVMEKTYLADKYYTKLTTDDPEMFVPADDAVVEEINTGYALVQHVLISNTPAANDDGSVPETEGYAEEAKKKAEDVLAKALAGENFATLVSTYGEDPGMASSPDGYLITETGHTLDGQSQMVAPFTKGSFAVAAGEVNPELVESDYGWHIIKRYAIDATHADYATLQENAKNSLMSKNYEAYLDSLMEKMDITKKDNIVNSVKVKY